MTKYEQIAGLAVASARRHFKEYADCQRIALGVAAGYADFLQCPRERVSFITLDEGLSRTGKSAPIGLDPMGSEVPLTLGTDGFWYFCIRIAYQVPGDSTYGCEFVQLGLHVNGSVASFRGDTALEIDITKPKPASELFEQLVHISMQRWNSPPPFLPSKRIGFSQ